MIQCCADTFELSELFMEDWFRERENYQLINDFLKGNGPPKILIYKQTPEPNYSSEEYIDSNQDEPKLFITFGDSVRIKAKAVFFYRTTPDGKPVTTSNSNDGEVIFGEMGSNSISSLDTIISTAFVPMVQALDDSEWGECDPEQRQELISGLIKFASELNEAIKSMSGGVKLRKPDSQFELDNVKEAAESEKVVAHYEKLMEEWIQQIEEYVEESPDGRWESNDAGPHTELEYWRGRNQKLTSINEQKKTKEVNFVRQVLNQVTKLTSEHQSRSKENIIMLLNRWKNVDIKITEALNEAKDNVKYLTTLEKFIEPLYSGTPQTIIDSLPALMNSVKMIHTIARYYNTTEKMTQLFMKITNQMINTCKKTILQSKSVDRLWLRDPDELIETMQACIRLKEAYQAQYELTREKLQAMPKGKQFDFSKNQIFGKFDLFCRRLTKLIDMFATVRQFRSLAKHNLENMEDLINSFKQLIEDFKNQRHDLLDYTNNHFDRRFVEFNVGISKLEQDLQGFINRSFEKIQSIDHSLNLLKKFQAILKRESLQSELQNKYNIIFHNYGQEMESIKSAYNQFKTSPPLVRNMPTVAGNILWSRHLFHRIQEPMERFPDEIKRSKDHRNYITLYNRIGQTLTLFEFMYLQAWCNEIERAKAGLQATLIWRTEDQKLMVNFDDEIFQLIREAKCLDRMGVEIPESARIVLLQEDKFKQYFNELDYLLKEYDRVLGKIRPITRPLLGPHLEDLEYKLRPGMVTLTWTSMNIDGYLHHVHSGLQKLEQLIISINDIIENRVENNLKAISKVILVEMPEQGTTYSQDEFVELQHNSAKQQTAFLVSKNIEVERAVDDLLATIKNYPKDQHVEDINLEEIIKLKKYYNWTMYQALLHCTKNSLNAMKERVCGKRSRKGDEHSTQQSPFFEVTVHLEAGPKFVEVHINPTLDDVQDHINRAAIAVLKCSKSVVNWFQQDVSDQEEKKSFYDLIAQDKEIVKVILLLTGSIHGTKKTVSEYLDAFKRFSWLWEEDVEKKLTEFSKKEPSLDDFEEKLRYFTNIEDEICSINDIHQIGAMALKTSNIKEGLKDYVKRWKSTFSKDLHKRARTKLENIFEYINQTKAKLQKEVTGIDTLRYVMQTLREVRQKEGEIELELKPIMEMYNILDMYLASGMEKDEQDHRHILRSKWKGLVELAESRQNELQETQNFFKKDLIRSVKSLIVDVKDFRKNYSENGPMVNGINPRDAVERLRLFKEEFLVRDRIYEINFAGEELFGLPHQQYPELEQTKKELDLLTQLYDLYVQVIDSVNSWKEMIWTEAVEKMDNMKDQIDQFGVMCRKLPRQLKEWDAYKELKQAIDDFGEVLPLLKDLSKRSIQMRHWQQLKEVTKANFNAGTDEVFYLSTLLEANLLAYKEDIEEIIESAEKQLKIEEQLNEIKIKWEVEMFDFDTYRNREYPCRLGGRVTEITDALDEASAGLTTMNAMKHVTPFKAEVMHYLNLFSDVGETIELWQKVQIMWQSLEPVFMAGDISRQMPTEARLFQNVDKMWQKIMERAVETQRVIPCCQNEMLKNLLPSLKEKLEQCQKSLDNYLEAKRASFARFYFCSDSVLLSILSQGSEPSSIQPFLENLFDAVTKVQFDRIDRKMITHIIGTIGKDEELIPLVEPVKCEGNIENWLKRLEEVMQNTMRDILRNGSRDCMQLNFGEFVNRYCSQASLVGLQLLWTYHVQECLEKAKDRKVAEAKKEKMNELWNILRNLCLSDLPNELIRTRIVTLITIFVNQRDVLDEIVSNLGKDASSKGNCQNSFDWLKRTRLYWRTDMDTCKISITDQDFEYMYEYLGTKERLCITPLTDRCYITLAQALGMNYGGAPAGPAGTGKTETVKDLGRTLGVFVVVTNCSDQQRYRDMAQIFKGLCQSGLWGCFDEFNRIQLEVLSVVAMQVQAINKAKKNKEKTCVFPGESHPISLILSVAYFITMNPGYAGRTELPENLKVLFRGVAMMVPDRNMIIRVRLAASGYDNYDILAKKFTVLYALCEEQLSKQKHYDFGLRNILSVLRTAGATKRKERESDEEMLMMRTLRDMNFSKLVKDDVALFLSLLKDIFPSQPEPKKASHGDVEEAINRIIKDEEVIDLPSWTLKIIQMYETALVRHGFMIVGPTGTGKSTILTVLTKALSETKIQHKIQRLNPKAMTAQELYGRKIEVTDEWIPGVFSRLWQKFNNRANKYNTWILCDGPVDTLWIENLNTVLDDNKILTLANNDRIPMTENVKLVFEVENLNNASPATVSRCGIVYISEDDLGWEPIVTAWCNCRASSNKVSVTGKTEEAEILRGIFNKYLKDENMMVNMYKKTDRMQPVQTSNPAVLLSNMFTLLTGLLDKFNEGTLQPIQYERIVIYCIVWSIGAMFEPEDRVKFHQYLVSLGAPLPTVDAGDTIYEYYINSSTKNWTKWQADPWQRSGKVTFASLLIPTMDSTRAEYLMDIITKMRLNHEYKKQVLLVGGAGTAKTSTILMYTSKLPENMVLKKMNFSSATLPKMFQDSIDSDLEKKTGRNYAPANNKIMMVFIDDMSMPFVNEWGDQVTLEIVRQLVEQGGYYFLEKDKIGDFKKIENLTFSGAMSHPGGGKNDIPHRLKRQFFAFNMTLPSKDSVDNIYGEMIRAFFTMKAFNNEDLVDTSRKLTGSTIALWEKVKKRFLPTPSQFHYLFNMRELSRVFQGVFECIKTRDGIEVILKSKNIGNIKPEVFLVGLWKHECERVFHDKLTTLDNKNEYKIMAKEITEQFFGADVEAQLGDGLLFADFQRKDKFNEDGELEEEAPKVYEAIRSIPVIKKIIEGFMERYNLNSQGKNMNLVLFDDAIKHLLRVSRIIQMDRGSALLVGVGGSGKQSLTRLAAFICKHVTHQIQLTKTYNQNALFADLLQLYKWSGHEGKKTTFIMTDSEIKDEFFLEFINSILSTGEVVGLLPKEERDIILADMRQIYQKERPQAPDPTNLELFGFFIERVRNNLHIVLCFSPVGDKFRDRFRKFPALFSGCTINWFLPWPLDALINVSSSLVSDFNIHATPETKTALTEHMGRVHNMVNSVCGLYYSKMRRHVYVTPKSYLSFISAYKDVYKVKVKDIEVLEKRVGLGLNKLNKAEEDVKKMQIQLEQDKAKIQEADRKTEEMLKNLEVEKSKAEKITEAVSKRREDCARKASEIQEQKDEANKDLQEAMPFLESALKAVDSITQKDISVVKTNKNPVDIIRLIIDGVLILLHDPVCQTKEKTHLIRKENIEFIADSFDEYGKSLIGNSNFLNRLIEFSQKDKDNINDETCELLEPYLRLEHFNPTTAMGASGAVAGLCTWVGAMVQYHEAAKIVKPKMDFLQVQEQRLEVAMNELEIAEKDLQECQAKLAKLQESVNGELAKKKVLEDNMSKLKRKTDQANKLISGLSDEKVRWTEDSHNFADTKRRLIGDVAVATAFVSYCGPFNSEFRSMLMKEYFINDLKNNEIPVTLSLDLTNFLIEKTTVAEWNLQGLPKDDLSTQNGIMVTRSSRFPLMIDPQGQAVKWIKNRNAENLKVMQMSGKFMDSLRFCLEQGMPVLIENIENEVDPELDPVLEKQIVTKGRYQIINISGQSVEWNNDFTLFMTSRLNNPHFSPELAAKTTIIDFTVTLTGLEQQLLGRVLSKKQKSLEESMQQLLEEITSNAKTLEQYNKNLLERLTNTEGNLLDDTELMEVLNNTKAKAKEVQQKLEEAAEKQQDINEKREQYRPVATRGSLLYFSIVEMSLVNWMYNTSLNQFLQKFDESVDKAEDGSTAKDKANNIIKTLTYTVYRYINRGLFEKDKLTFLLMVSLKILLISGKLGQGDVDLLLRVGGGLDKKAEKPNPFGDMINGDVWMNVIALSRHPYGRENLCIFRELPESMNRYQADWRNWIKSDNPEKIDVPEFHDRIMSERDIGKFVHFTLVRSMREDRTIICAIDFIEHLLGKEFVKPETDKIEEIWAESTNRVPVLFLLSAGADPTGSIEELAKKKRKPYIEKVSMGEGQDVIALEAMRNSFLNGNWVVLYNCHLGMNFMAKMENLLGQDTEIEDEFRLWLTCEPREKFPLGLLQMAIKVTNEPPKGVKAGLQRTFSTIIDNDFLEKHDDKAWRRLSFAICFLHSVVQERRKFGPLGWCIPYEFNNSDLEASLCFLDGHIYQAETMNQSPNLEIVRFMVCDVQYGGRITDSMDFKLMQAFGAEWIDDRIFTANFSFGDQPEYKMITDNNLEIAKYREYIDALPNFEKPRLFFLNNNADITFRKREGNELLNTIQMTQPKESDSGSGKSRDDVIHERVLENLAKLPTDYIEAEVREGIRKLRGAKNSGDQGFRAPLNVFLFQEIMRMQRVVNIVRRTLNDLIEVHAGNIILTPELQDAADALYDTRVPAQWIYDLNRVEISWLIPNLGNWMAGLQERHTQLNTWLKEDRPTLYNLGLFFNPQGFLTAVKQEVTRQHKNEGWALDDVEEQTFVKDYSERPREIPDKGVLIRGLFLEGAKWGTVEGGRLEELDGKDTYVKMPNVHVTAKVKDKSAKGKDYEDFGTYKCPCYKYPQRTDRYYIFDVKLRSESSQSNIWRLRGVALLCTPP
jgi:dynein heavy chain